MNFDILTLFPDMFAGPFGESIIRRGIDKGLVDIRLHQIRDFAVDRHKTTDDAPYGGGCGMVMKVEPLAAALDVLRSERPRSRVILTTPRGRTFDQETATRLALEEGLIIICGRYEGVDERVAELYVDEELSIGDYVLSGGELAAMVITDATVRLVPGVLGNEESALTDTFSDGLLEHPHYTRPPEFRGVAVPEVLLSGNHAAIALWRRRESLRQTWRLRPELLQRIQLSKADRAFLRELQQGSAE
ncbi:MAG TPA: tRNA (guanosine(37)-N1)-methyltransferase TrmD [Geobacterales bacterium]|nr:tRNA (guanosine(37)-N1)-methyltransferase TrmD [Geobacterales bacterium]